MGSREMRNCKAQPGLCAGYAVSQAHARIRGAVSSGPASPTHDRSRMREFRTYGSVRGRPVMGVPTAILDPLLPFVVASPTSAVQRVRSFAATA